MSSLNEISIMENTTFSINKETLSLELKTGQINTSFSDTDKRIFRINTPHISLGQLDASLSVISTAQGTEITVNSGTITVSNRLSGEINSLSSGEKMTFSETISPEIQINNKIIPEKKIIDNEIIISFDFENTGLEKWDFPPKLKNKDFVSYDMGSGLNGNSGIKLNFNHGRYFEYKLRSVPETDYRLTVNLRYDNQTITPENFVAYDINAGISLEVFNTDWKKIAVSELYKYTSENQNQWKRLSLDFTAESDISFLRIMCESKNQIWQVSVDDIQIIKINK